MDLNLVTVVLVDFLTCQNILILHESCPHTITNTIPVQKKKKDFQYPCFLVILNRLPQVAENDRFAFILCILGFNIQGKMFYVYQDLRLNFLIFWKELSFSFPFPIPSSTLLSVASTPSPQENTILNAC
jgi:hypothetical protein